MLRVSYGHFSLFLVHSLPSACLTSTRQRPRVVVGPDIILSYPRTMCIALEKGAAISAQNDTTVWISPRNSTLHIFFSFELPLCGTSDCPIAIATLHPDSHLIFLPFSLPLSRSLSLSLSLLISCSRSSRVLSLYTDLPQGLICQEMLWTRLYASITLAIFAVELLRLSYARILRAEALDVPGSSGNWISTIARKSSSLPRHNAILR